MSVFDTIRALKEKGLFEEAWSNGFDALEQDRQNIFLQTSLFWVIYAALKHKIDPIKQRENTKPRQAEQIWIDTWVTRISELNLTLPNDNIDGRLWFLFTQKDIGKYCSPLCLYILVSGHALFRLEDYTPYRTEQHEVPSIVCKLARIVAANYLQNKAADIVPVGRVTGLLQHAIEATQDSTHKIWLIYDKARILVTSGQIERAREAYLDILEKKRSEPWAWFGLATTYEDEPLKASSLVAYGLTCVHDPKYSVSELYHFAKLLEQQTNYADASRALLRLYLIYQQNGWQLTKEITELMSRSWYDGSLDETALDMTITKLAKCANHYAVQHPVTYKGIVTEIHKSGKGANVYISTKQIIPVLKILFQTHFAFHAGTFVDLLCDKRSGQDIPVSVEQTESFASKHISTFSGVLKLHEKGFGFVDSIFIPQPLIGTHNSGETITGIAVVKFDNIKRTNGLVAIAIKSSSSDAQLP